MTSVLLVECQTEMASDIAARLRDIGYDVTAVYDTLAALDALNTRAWFDVLVTRVRLHAGNAARLRPCAHRAEPAPELKGDLPHSL